MSTVANVALTPTSKNKGRVGSARERERERKMKRLDDILDRGISSGRGVGTVVSITPVQVVGGEKKRDD